MIVVPSTREIEGSSDSAPVPLHFPRTAGHLPMHLLPAASVPPSREPGRAVPPSTSHDSSEELCDLILAEVLFLPECGGERAVAKESH